MDTSAFQKLQKERIQNYTNVFEKLTLENYDNLPYSYDYNYQFKQEFSLFPDLFANADSQ